MSIKAAMIDNREPAWVQALTFSGAMVAVTRLEHGDVLATTDDGALVAVERKTADDLLGSLKDGRLWTQLAGMRQQTAWAYLVVCGPLACSASGNVATQRGETGWSWASLQGALVKAQELGVIVVIAPDDKNFEPTVISLSARSHAQAEIIKPAKDGILLNEGEQILASLPGVGQERLSALLQYTSRPCWALSFLTHLGGGDKVDGIGKGTKQRIRQALRLADNEELSVIVTDTGMIAQEEPK